MKKRCPFRYAVVNDYLETIDSTRFRQCPLVEAQNTPTNTGNPKLPGLKKYLEWADKREIRKTGHRLTQSDLDLLEAGYGFIARQLRAGA